MSAAECENASDAIIDALSSLEEFKKAKSVFIYLASSTEPNTHELVGLALAMEKTVAVPRVRGDEMDAVIITPYTDFRTNKWGILEPVKGCTLENVELSIVPLVAYDGLKRAGHGKGYYDKFLQAHPCKTIGLAFDCQKSDGLETEKHDKNLDMLVTEKRIIKSAKVTMENVFGGEL